MSIDLIRRRDFPVRGAGDGSLYRAKRSGNLTRVIAGSYADAQVWSGLWPIEQHRIRVLETADRLKTDVVFSHFAAAALWGIRMRGAWPQVVDVTLERASGGRSDGGLRRHCTGLDSIPIDSVDGLPVTTPAQTVVDLARALPFADGVVAMDSALHRKRRPHPLTTINEINEVLSDLAGRRGAVRLRQRRPLRRRCPTRRRNRIAGPNFTCSVFRHPYCSIRSP